MAEFDQLSLFFLEDFVALLAEVLMLYKCVDDLLQVRGNGVDLHTNIIYACWLL